MNKPKATNVQLKLFSKQKHYGTKSYDLVAAERDAEMAKVWVAKLRELGCAVRVQRDKEGEIDVKGSYLIWARLKDTAFGDI